MKKIIIFLLAILFIGMNCTKVDADTFYEGEYISDIYTRSVAPNGTSKYQEGRVFRRSSDGKEAYCLQPFAIFNSSSNYIAADYPVGLDPSIFNRMVLIANYGYGYGNHTDPKWYAITQMMIWHLAEPNADIYFTDTLNGNRVDRYTAEMNEINALVDNFNVTPNLVGANTNIVGSTIVLEDTNNVLNNYIIEDTHGKKIRIEGNKLIYENVAVGTVSITMKRKIENENTPALFYYSNTSQNLLTKGTIKTNKLEVQLSGSTNEVRVTKIDSDTNSTTPSGEGVLLGTSYGMYDANDNLIEEITFFKDTETIRNLSYGKYYLKEISPGLGYTLNTEKKEFTIDQNTTTLNIEVKNKIIEKEVVIHKEYGELNNTVPESGISFEIYNNMEMLVDTITTDKDGNASIKLPYGRYTVKQKNTKDGYKKVEDFVINLYNETVDYHYNLYDYQEQKEVKIHKEYGTTGNMVPEEGIRFDIYDNKGNLVNTVTTDSKGDATTSLPYGKYIVKQKNTKYGYTKVEDFEIELVSGESKDYSYKLYNYQIQKEIKIHKEYGTTGNMAPEEGISFDIYDNNGNLINTVTTDSKGDATTSLPYGKYIVKQKNTKYGYTKAEDFEIEVNDKRDDYTYKVYNYQIHKEIKIHKEHGLDEDMTPEDGISFEIYDSNGNLVNTITTDSKGDASIKLPYGKYTIKQKNTSYGYTKVKDFEIEINDDNSKNYTYKLYDYQIQKEIKIHKEYGTLNNTLPEEGISFDIYDNNGRLVNTVTTDSKGDASIKLPYGKYIVKQRNTSVGYNKTEDFEIEVNGNKSKDYTYNLYDYKIEIPNTGIKESSSYLFFLLLAPFIYFLKRKYVL